MTIVDYSTIDEYDEDEVEETTTHTDHDDVDEHPHPKPKKKKSSDDPFALREGKTLLWRNVNMTLVSFS
jgi:hypothetical protein